MKKKQPIKDLKGTINKMLHRIVSLLMIVAIIWALGTGRYWWIIGVFAAYGLWKLWVLRAQYMSMLRYIETFLWGKPLEKDLWDKGEWKNRKIHGKIKLNKWRGGIKHEKKQEETE